LALKLVKIVVEFVFSVFSPRLVPLSWRIQGTQISGRCPHWSWETWYGV